MKFQTNFILRSRPLALYFLSNSKNKALVFFILLTASHLQASIECTNYFLKTITNQISVDQKSVPVKSQEAIQTVYQGVLELNRIQSHFQSISESIEVLTNFLNEKHSIETEIQKLKKEMDAVLVSISKQGKISLQSSKQMNQAFEGFSSLIKKLKDVKENIDFLSSEAQKYLDLNYNSDLDALKNLKAKVGSFRNGMATSNLIQNQIVKLMEIKNHEQIISEVQSFQSKLYSSYSLMELSKTQLLLEARKYTNEYQKFEDKPILLLDEQFGPSHLVAAGAEHFEMNYEIGVKETLFGFKPVFILGSQRIKNKNIATLNPNVSVMGVSRGTFFKSKNKLLAVVGFFPDATVLVDVINPSKNKSKLKRMKLSDLKKYQEIPSSGINRPLVYGDAFYLENVKYVYGKTLAMNDIDDNMRYIYEKRTSIAKHYAYSGLSFAGFVALASYAGVSIINGVVQIGDVAQLASVSGVLGATLYAFGNHIRGMHHAYEYKLANPLIHNLKNIYGSMKPFEFASGEHHQFNNYHLLVRDNNIYLDSSEISSLEKKDFNGNSLGFLTELVAKLNEWPLDRSNFDSNKEFLNRLGANGIMASALNANGRSLNMEFIKSELERVFVLLKNPSSEYISERQDLPSNSVYENSIFEIRNWSYHRKYRAIELIGRYLKEALSSSSLSLEEQNHLLYYWKEVESNINHRDLNKSKNDVINILVSLNYYNFFEANVLHQDYLNYSFETPEDKRIVEVFLNYFLSQSRSKQIEYNLDSTESLALDSEISTSANQEFSHSSYQPVQSFNQKMNLPQRKMESE